MKSFCTSFGELLRTITRKEGWFSSETTFHAGSELMTWISFSKARRNYVGQAKVGFFSSENPKFGDTPKMEYLSFSCWDVLMCWCVDVVHDYCVDVLMYWCVGVLMCWWHCVDVLMMLLMTVLVCQCVDDVLMLIIKCYSVLMLMTVVMCWCDVWCVGDVLMCSVDVMCWCTNRWCVQNTFNEKVIRLIATYQLQVANQFHQKERSPFDRRFDFEIRESENQWSPHPITSFQQQYLLFQHQQW